MSGSKALRSKGNAKRFKAMLLREHGYRCMACKRIFSRRELQLDHIVPLSRGGWDEYFNTQLLCDPCHEHKGLSRTDHRGAGCRALP